MSSEFSLVLRFRNKVPGCNDNLGAHRALLKAHGHFWWGWWKRDSELDRVADVRGLAAPFIASAISGTEELAFAFTVSEVRAEVPPDIEAIPEHYRDRAHKIPLWLRVTQVRALDKTGRHALLARFGGRPGTLFLLQHDNEVGGSVADGDATSIEVGDIPTIVHLSDLHFGDDHAFAKPRSERAAGAKDKASMAERTLARAIANDLKHLGVVPAAILITGDHVTRSKWTKEPAYFVNELSEYLALPVNRIISVPGNHDFFRGNEEVLDPQSMSHEDSFLVFRNQVWNESVNAPIEKIVRIRSALTFDILLGTLNSARWTTVKGFAEYGFVGRDRLLAVLERMNSSRPAIRMLALHHHLLPVALREEVSERPVSVTLDAASVIEEVTRAGISMIVHGHQHTPVAMKTARRRALSTSTAPTGPLDKELHILSGGSAGSKTLYPSVPNTYALLRFGTAECTYSVRTLDAINPSDGRELMSVSIPLSPH